MKFLLKNRNKIFSKNDIRRIFFLLIFLCVGAMLELAGISLFLPLVQMFINPDSDTSKLVMNIVGLIIPGIDFELATIVVCICVVCAFVLKNVFLFFSLNYQYHVIYSFQSDLRARLMRGYISQPYVFHANKNSADINRSLTADVYNFGDFLVGMLQFASELSVCTLLVVFLMVTDVVTTLVVMLILVCFSILYFIPMKKKLSENGRKNQAAYSGFVKSMNEAWGSIKEIKVKKCEESFIESFRRHSDEYAQTRKYGQIIGAMPKFILESLIIIGLVSAVIIKVISGGEISEMVSQLSVFAIAAYRLGPSINRMDVSYALLHSTMPSVELVLKDIEESECTKYKSYLENESDCIVVLEDGLSIRNISFSYPGTGKLILSDVNMDIKEGTSVGIVGETGAGKTTLVDIILGLLTPDKGTIYYEGEDVFSNKDIWLERISYIPQNIYVLDDTIRNNVAFGIPESDIDDQQIWTALKEAQLDKYVMALNDGLDTVVGEMGARLSGGQCQRLGIARALFSKPSIIVMDEATSALDNNTEKAVMESIEHLHGKVTLIIIAHRLTTIEKCDEVYEVGDRKVRKVR